MCWSSRVAGVILAIVLGIIILLAFDLNESALFPKILQLAGGDDLDGPEIQLTERAVIEEGIGAVLQGMKPVLLLSNHTGARIKLLGRNRRAHGYNLDTYLRFSHPKPRRWHSFITRHALRARRVVPCNVSETAMQKLLGSIQGGCESFNWSTLPAYGVFTQCNTVVINRYLNHPRSCLVHTERLVREFTRFQVPSPPPVAKRRAYTDVCVLRRGGDVEHAIMHGKGNQWALDDELTLPILSRLKQRGRRIVLATETKLAGIDKKYSASVYSRNEGLHTTISRLLACRCLFVASCSSFQVSVTQVVAPL